MKASLLGLVSAGETASRQFFDRMRDYQAALFGSVQPAHPDLPFCGGVLGYISYDAGNGLHGVMLYSGSGHTVQGNTIGLDMTGTAALPNGQSGMTVSDAPNNTFGGTAAGPSPPGWI